MRGVLHTDGGARGNPGPAAIGVVLEFPKTDRPALEVGETIGETTNNVAEYRAILRGLALARSEGVTELECYVDSELIARQINGDYRVKDAKLQPLARDVENFRRGFRSVTFTSVPRSENRRADKLVNVALDRSLHRKNPIPGESRQILL
jgi:ribonuclease HI